MASMALGLLTAAPTIVQGIASLVHGIENIFGKGSGAAKKAAVLSAFQGGVQAYQAVATTATGLNLPKMSGDTETAFSNLIDAIVAFNNAVGIFTSTAKK
jgi:uncharacterized membrane protein HdeD (DUF308 family)